MDMIFINGEPLPGKLVGYKGTLIDVDGKEAGTTEAGIPFVMFAAETRARFF